MGADTSTLNQINEVEENQNERETKKENEKEAEKIEQEFPEVDKIGKAFDDTTDGMYSPLSFLFLTQIAMLTLNSFGPSEAMKYTSSAVGPNGRNEYSF